MNRLAVVASFLFVPPIGVGVAELALFGGWVNVAAVLVGIESVSVVGDMDFGVGEVPFRGHRCPLGRPI